jgi:hypothetical protein
MAEWFGKGLQSPVRRFDSGSRLEALTRAGGSTRQLLRRDVDQETNALRTDAAFHLFVP